MITVYTSVSNICDYICSLYILMWWIYSEASHVVFTLEYADMANDSTLCFLQHLQVNNPNKVDLNFGRHNVYINKLIEAFISLVMINQIITRL